MGKFSQLIVEGNFNVKVLAGNSDEVTISAAEEALKYVSIVNSKGKLVIKWANNTKNKITNTKVNITLHNEALSAIALKGSGDLTIAAVQKSDTVNIALTGSGDLNAKINSKIAKVSLNGSGDLTVAGETDNLDIAVSGSGDLNAASLQSKFCKVTVTGSGNSEVNVSNSLSASILGSGDVTYTGNPTVKTNINGSGSVVQKN